MGMLMSAAYILAMDTFGPITDNAGGIVEMSDQPESGPRHHRRARFGRQHHQGAHQGLRRRHRRTRRLPALLGVPGEVKRFNGTGTELLASVNLAEPKVFVGGLIGAMLVFVFTSFAIRAVGNAAGDMIEEVRRQFRADPGIMAGTSTPDYAALRRHLGPRRASRDGRCPACSRSRSRSSSACILGWEAAAGMLMIGTIAGVLMATLPQQRRWRLGQRQEVHRGRRSEGRRMATCSARASDAHAAAVVGDTVGDPFKDTAGPSLHVLIKLLATITLVLAPLFI